MRARDSKIPGHARMLTKHQLVYVDAKGAKLDVPVLVGVSYRNPKRAAAKADRAARKAARRKHAQARALSLLVACENNGGLRGKFKP